MARDETGNDEGSGMILLRAAFSRSINVCTFNAHWEGKAYMERCNPYVVEAKFTGVRPGPTPGVGRRTRPTTAAYPLAKSPRALLR